MELGRMEQVVRLLVSSSGQGNSKRSVYVEGATFWSGIPSPDLLRLSLASAGCTTREESFVTTKKHVRPSTAGRDSLEPHKSAIDHLPLDDRSLNCFRPRQIQVLG